MARPKLPEGARRVILDLTVQQATLDRLWRALPLPRLRNGRLYGRNRGGAESEPYGQDCGD